jgi:hypothetical protein
MKQSIYYFTCACGCGQVSEDLKKQYIRLRKGQKWVAKSCVDNKEIVAEIAGGYVIKENDF